MDRIDGLTAFYRFHPEVTVGKIIRIIRQEDGRFRLSLIEAAVPKIETPSSPPSHNEIRDMIVEIGRMKGWVSESEYPVDNWRLDAVWKEIEKGVPKKVFEVHLSGNPYEAMVKLQHSSHLWSSALYLITNEEEIERIIKWLDGAFHGIKARTKIVPRKKIEELHRALKDARKIEDETGLGDP